MSFPLHAYSLCSRPAGGVLAAMLLRVFAAACCPLLATLHTWLHRGILDDPAAEFFVQASGERPPWHSALCFQR